MTGIYTVKELAEILQISEWTIYQLCKEKKIKHFKIGKSIRICEEDLMDYIEKSRRICSK